MPVITLDKLVVHTDETVKNEVTSLKPGNVECVFTIDGAGGQGRNFVSLQDCLEWAHQEGIADAIEGGIKAVVLECEKLDPLFENLDAIKGIELETKVVVEEKV